MDETTACSPAAGIRAPVPWRAAAAVFVAVLAARWALIAAAGSDVPFWDQWDGEAWQFYRPWLEGRLGWAEWFAPHNEHRIVLTRLVNLGVLAANGHWDPLLTMVLLAVVPAAVAAGLVVAVGRCVAGGGRVALVVAVTLLFALPHAWQNTLWSFQSQVFLAVATAVVALASATLRDARRGPGWLGWGAAVLAPFAMGTAAALGTALAAVAAWRWRTDPAGRRAAGEVALQALLVFAVARLLAVEVPAHAALRATDWATFAAAWLHGLSWPFLDLPLAAIGLNAPLLVLGAAALAGRGPRGALAGFALGLGAWAGVIAAGFAWMRGAVGGTPASRYLDFLQFLPLANLLALFAWRQVLPAGRPARLFAGAAAGWVVLGIAALAWFETRVWRDSLAPRIAAPEFRTQLVTGYRETGNAAVLAAIPLSYNPVPDRAALDTVLRDPRLREIAPPSLQDSIVPAWGPDAATLLRAGARPSDVMPPVFGASWGNFGRSGPGRDGSTASEPFDVRRPRLEFSVVHTGPDDAVTVTLRDATSAREIPVPLGPGDGRWREVRVAVVPGAYRLHVAVRSTEARFAFTAPRPLSRASSFVREGRSWSAAFVGVAVLAALAAAVPAGRDPRRTRA